MSNPPPPPPGSPAPGDPTAVPPPPAFQPGVATPSYIPPQQSYPPTSAFPAYGPAGQPMGPPPGKGGGGGSATLLWSLIAVFALLLCIGAGAAGVIAYRNSQDGSTPATDPTRAPAPDPTREPDEDDRPIATPRPTEGGAGVVTYEVTGDGPARITYQANARGAAEQVRSATLPWRVEVSMSEDIFSASVFATRVRANQGSITCRVLIDGEEVVSRTARGPRAVAVCLKINFD